MGKGPESERADAKSPTKEVKRVFKAPRNFDLDALLQHPKVAFAVRQDRVHTRRLEYFDSADWRMARSSLLLFSDGETLWLRSSDPAELSLSVNLGHGKNPLQGLPEGELKDRVEATLRGRPLQKQFALESTIRAWRILNQEEKTVARLSLTEHVAGLGAKYAGPVPLVEVKSLRGYEKFGRKLSDRLKEQGFRQVREPYDLQRTAVGGQTAAKDAPQLIPWMPALEALRLILHPSYLKMRDNEEGIRQDRDVECLHDYRVAVRRTRTALGELRGVLASEQIEDFRRDFSWLGKATNRLRDLDVYLLLSEDYKSMIPGSLGQDIEPFFLALRRERQAALSEFVGVLSSAPYRSLRARWEAFLEGEGSEKPGPDASREIMQLARKRVARRCHRVLKKGRGVALDADPQAFHALRVECKHLRYLLEFFSSVLPDARGPIRRLRKLQDALGRMQDLVVHEKRLAEYIHALSRGHEPAEPGTLRAATQLRLRMQAEQHRTRTQVPGLFAGFLKSLGKTDPPYATLLPWLES